MGRTIYVNNEEYDIIECALSEVSTNYECASDENYLEYWDKAFKVMNKFREKFFGIKR